MDVTNPVIPLQPYDYTSVHYPVAIVAARELGVWKIFVVLSFKTTTDDLLHSKTEFS